MKKKTLFFKIAFLSWLLIIVTLGIFIISTIPYQKRILIERMTSEARDVASSISSVTATAIISEDYSFALEHCLTVVNESKSVLYTVITKKDGFSLIFTDQGWKMDTLYGKWVSTKDLGNNGKFIFEDLVNQDVFYYEYPFSYSGIDWGWIHIGLSLEKYNIGIKELYIRTISSSLLAILIGFVVSIIFARRISKPIHLLNEATKKVTNGDFTARSQIKSGDELENLSDSFNKMTESLAQAHTNLEERVRKRTAELAKTNLTLEKEINERKKGEEIVQSSLQDKEILLKEIHHRVKNNLQIISSLLYLQSKKLKNDEIQNILKDSQTRVKSMALVHEKLYQSKTLSHINFKEYIENLTNYIFNYYKHSKNIRLKTSIENIDLNIDTAVPCGLIINELVSNSMKYGFPDDYEIEKPEIKISVKKNDATNYTLNISDNGIGLPKNFDLQSANSLGLKLVTSLVLQIEGDIKYFSENGTKFIIKFIDRNKVRTK